MSEMLAKQHAKPKSSAYIKLSPGSLVVAGLLVIGLLLSSRSLPTLSKPCRAGGSQAGAADPEKPEVVVVVGAPVLADVNFSLLQHVLPLTNFSSLSSASVLDSAVAAKASQQTLRQLMQFHQQMFCSARLHELELPGVAKVPFGNVSMFLYNGKDIVSNQLKGRFHNWEDSEVQEMLWALRQHNSKMQQRAAAVVRRPLPAVVAAGDQGSSSSTSGQPPLFVDVGANVGWFMLNAAAAGAKVAAFEAMSNNVALLRRSLCANPWLAERIALFGTGLGIKSSTCGIVSGATNRGDGLTICDQDVNQAIVDLKKASNETYEARGEMTIRRLDTLLAEDVQVMKIDVEGFELQVLEGAEQLLANHNVWYIMAECNRNIIGLQGQRRYLKFLDRMGFAISTVSFRGPFLSQQSAASGSATLSSYVNLYCTKKPLAKLHDDERARVAAAAAPSSGQVPAAAGRKHRLH